MSHHSGCRGPIEWAGAFYSPLYHKLPEAKRGFVLLPRRWVVKCSFAWAPRCRRLAQNDARLPTTFAVVHVVDSACLMLHRLRTVVTQSP